MDKKSLNAVKNVVEDLDGFTDTECELIFTKALQTRQGDVKNG